MLDKTKTLSGTFIPQSEASIENTQVTLPHIEEGPTKNGSLKKPKKGQYAKKKGVNN
jgi:hypothetical protein